MATGNGPKANDLFTAISHPLRRRILRRMLETGGETSPRQLATDLDVPLSALSYHVRVLAECEAVELVRTKQIRGSTQHFYRAVVKAEWARSALAAAEKPPKAKQRQRKGKAAGEENG
jgi:DNA-binding transcriptional ArsR family regulator